MESSAAATSAPASAGESASPAPTMGAIAAAEDAKPAVEEGAASASPGGAAAPPSEADAGTPAASTSNVVDEDDSTKTKQDGETTAEQSTPGPAAAAQATAPASSSTTQQPSGPPVMVMKYTSMLGVSGAIQTKNMSSSFMKEDKQSWWHPQTQGGRRETNTGSVMKERKQKKRRRMLDGGAGDEEDESTKSAPGEREADGDDDGDEAMQTENNSRGSSPASSTASTTDVKGKRRQSEKNANLPDPAKVLIIHPGSRNLRIGRASDAVPIEVPNVIARKVKGQVAQTSDTDSSRNKELSEDSLEILRLDLRARMRIMKLRGTTGGSAAAKEYNDTVRGQPVAPEQDDFPITWIDPSSSSDPPAKEVYFGEEALRLVDPEPNGYSVRYPYRSGTFNTECYTLPQELLGDIMAIWLDALQTKLEISPRDLDQYSVVLLIPDLYQHVYVKEMCELMLKTMGFAQIILQQEGLCASFAAGLPSACVLDIGASKISISCIDEGMVINDSRMLMKFGGDDIAQTFTQVVKTIDFPYKEVDLTKNYDWDLMTWLAEQCCCFNEHNFGVNTFEFSARKPGVKTTRYSMKLYDEVILPTGCFWQPRVLDWDLKLASKPTLWRTAKDEDDDVDGLIDIGGDAVTLAMKKATAHLEQPRPTTAGTVTTANQGASGSLTVPSAGTDGDTPMDGVQSTAPPSPAVPDDAASSAPGTPAQELKPTYQADVRASSPAVSVSGTTSKTAAVSNKADTPAPVDNTPSIDHFTESSKLPLDVALLESLSHSGSDDKLKRVITNILIVGGIGNMQGVGFALQSRLEPLIKARFPGAPAPLVIPTSKYADAAHVAWRGIQNLCKLEIINEMWIRQDDWEYLNLRAVRDRCAFTIP